MPRLTLPLCNIHMDYHTSELIPGVGAQFDPDDFADTLQRAGVQSVCCFARCHHGWMYYDTKLFPERLHPTLADRNLLKHQIEACRRRGIRVPIYITVQWDHYSAQHHPDWLARTVEGDEHTGDGPRHRVGFYTNLCVNTTYRDFLKAHTQEVLESLSGDGIFFDITIPIDCCCDACRLAMQAQGIDPLDDRARQAFGTNSIRQFEGEMARLVRRFNPEASIYFNGNRMGYNFDAFTHLEFDALPGGHAGGYMNLQLHVRYGRTLGLSMMGQTGRFHTSWGDFHSFRHPVALRYECSQLLALGAGVCIGDQLHPSGKMCHDTYDLIGGAYREVRAIEPWCAGARPVSEVGVLSPERINNGGHAPDDALRMRVEGAGRILDEAGHQWDVLDAVAPLDGYALLILPDVVEIDEALAARLNAYVEAGGALLLSFDCALPCAGVELVGPSPFRTEYVQPQGDIGAGLPSIEHVMYTGGRVVRASDDAQVLAWTLEPYFDRTNERFCSHRHTPSSGVKAHPAIVRRGRCIYFAHSIFKQYITNAPAWCGTLVRNAIDLLLPEPLLRHDGPSTVLATINQQAAHDRWVLHVLHFIPERRSVEADIVRDVIPLHDLRLSVRTARSPKRVTCGPQDQAIDFEMVDGRATFTLPRVDGHQVVAIDFA